MKNTHYILLFFILCSLPSYGQNGHTLNKIEHTEITFHCGWTEKLNVINNQKELDKFIINSDLSDCVNQNTIQEIDFNKYTLVGYGSSQSGCNAPTINLSFKKINDVIFINAAVTIEGLCKGYFNGKTWTLIPKIKKKESINFEVSYIYPTQ